MTESVGLLAVGRPPERNRSTGRRPGKFRGHERAALELKTQAARHADPKDHWGMVANQVTAAQSQSISQAIKKGQAVGFEHNGGHYEARTHRSTEQRGAPKGKPFYEVWARWVSGN